MVEPASGTSANATPSKLTATQWLICIVAAIGFAFDIYELLVMPLIARPALAELLGVDPMTDSGNGIILSWTGYITYASAVCGGIFGLLGGYLTDRFGRRRVLVWSILLYAVSAAAAGFVTTPMQLLVLRCTTFIGVCVEFVAAVAWLAEVFPEPKRREAVLGYTQAFSSFGGLMVSGVYALILQFADSLPAIHGDHSAWRYTLISGLLPAIPLIIIRPFLPESPAWAAKRRAGTLKRPSLGQLFGPELFRTSIVTALMFACTYGAAFGAIQLMPQIVPGLDPELPKQKKLRIDYEAMKVSDAKSPQLKEMKTELARLGKKQQSLVATTQLWYQEMAGLAGRFALAFLAVRIVSRRRLLHLFQVPGLILLPLVFWFPARDNLQLFQWGLAGVAFCTVAQMSFWGNYLPRVYPVHLRGTGESFAANVGGRMLGTSAQLLATQLAGVLAIAGSPFAKTAAAAAVVGGGVYLIGFIASFFLPEPKLETESE